MKTILSLILAIGTTAMLLSSCQKNEVGAPQTSTSQSPGVLKSYGPHALYEIELSANASGHQGGGVWLWIALYPDFEGDYAGSDCGHGEGAASDMGDVTWNYTAGNDSVVVNGVVLNGLSGFPTTITVPAQYGHYTGTIGTFLTLPPFIPAFIGHSQLQVAP